MKYLNKIFFVFLNTIVFATIAQFSTPKYSNEFLNIGVGAKALSMGNAQVSTTDDVTSAYWNPSGLLNLSTDYEVSLMHAEYFAGIAKYDYIGFATRIDNNSVLGISAIRLGIDDIPDTRFLFDASGVLNYDNVRFFSASDYAFLISYAHRYRNWNIGGNAKVIYRNVGQFADAWGFGFDLGVQRKWKNGISFGANIYDVTTTFNVWSINSSLLEQTFVQTGNEIPLQSVELTLPKSIFSGSYAFSIKERVNLLWVLDAQLTFDGKRNTLISSYFTSIDPRLGMQLDYKNIVFLRGGATNYQKVKDFDGTMYTSIQPNFGIGLKIKKVAIDYALTDVGNVGEVLFSNIFSIKIQLDKNKLDEK